MEDSGLKYVGCKVSDGLALVKLRYAEFLGFDAYDHLQGEFEAVADEEGVDAVLVNLDALEHITSRFIGILAALSSRLSQKDRRLAICRMRPEALRAFKLCRMDSLIPTYDSEDEARAALGL